MNIIEYYYKKIIKYDLINKFNYKNINEIPKIKKVILSFNYNNNYKLKNIVSALVALKLIVNLKHIKIIKSKKSNILIKIKAGQPVGFKITLKKKHMYSFFFKLLIEIFPSLKKFDNIKDLKNYNQYSFSVSELINFKELEKKFYLFSHLTSLNIQIITDTGNIKELIYFMKSFKMIKI